MTTIRQLVKIALTATTAALLSLVAAPGAWAMIPVPDPASAGSTAAPMTTVMHTAGRGGFGGWQVVTIGAICALVAGAVTLIGTRLVQSHTHHSRLAHA
jgi:hypothetical protein